MKKELALAVATFLGAGMTAAHAVDGTINFTGTVTADTCTTAVNDQTNPTLNLGQVNAATLATQGATGPATDFTLGLTSCPETVTTVGVTFSGTSAPLNTAFTNEATNGAATNVGVQIYDGTNAKVSPDKAVDVSAYLTGGAAQIPFSARIIATADTATAGSVVSHADYTINYN